VRLQCINANLKKRANFLAPSPRIFRYEKKNNKCPPETIAFYNDTKYGVDMLDQMAKKYSTKVSSRRWPLRHFTTFQI
jgi:hypothetical protein